MESPLNMKDLSDKKVAFFDLLTSFLMAEIAQSAERLVRKKVSSSPTASRLTPAPWSDKMSTWQMTVIGRKC